MIVRRIYASVKRAKCLLSLTSQRSTFTSSSSPSKSRLLVVEFRITSLSEKSTSSDDIIVEMNKFFKRYRNPLESIPRAYQRCTFHHLFELRYVKFMNSNSKRFWPKITELYVSGGHVHYCFRFIESTDTPKCFSNYLSFSQRTEHLVRFKDVFELPKFGIIESLL